ncbi:hypothetical protein SLS60_010085 [Paraconiothyrium brasiliense]|uniref:Uncharacterized protein n=1 Tax=Paraconiothyrium brasiliense TaxID=300254 RepID=A0ABR3QQ95_9PLEO
MGTGQEDHPAIPIFGLHKITSLGTYYTSNKMKFTTALLITLIGIATAAPAPALDIEKRFPSSATKVPIYSHRWQNNVWTPATDNVGRAVHTTALETISTFDITAADVGKTFKIQFWSDHITTPPKQAIQIFTNNNVPQTAGGVPPKMSNGRNVFLGSFLAQYIGDAVEISPSESQLWKTVRFTSPGKYAFNVVGIYVQNPTDLTWNTRTEGLYLKRV